MSRPTTDRLKVNPALGAMPVLQYCTPDQLEVDSTYQRRIEAETSRTLIRRIAQFWDWGLCQPLIVSRRADDRLFVVDGQHRLQAAKMRGDIGQLPCVVTSYRNAEEEAASFVALNQQRRPLSALDVFKAAVAAGDPESVMALQLIEGAGLSVAPHSNYHHWKPAMISNIPGILSSLRKHGRAATGRALLILATAFKGEVLRYCGMLFRAVAPVVAEFGDRCDDRRFVRVLRCKSQHSWTAAFLSRQANDGRTRAAAEVAVIRDAYRAARDPAPPIAARDVPSIAPLPPQHDGQWCDQCDRRVTGAEVDRCADRFCKAKAQAA